MVVCGRPGFGLDVGGSLLLRLCPLVAASALVVRRTVCCSKESHLGTFIASRLESFSSSKPRNTLSVYSRRDKYS